MKQEEEGSYNIFRDSLLRYAGYANEVGESFRYQIPRLVAPSYVVSFGYCFADAASTGKETWQQKSSSTTSENSADNSWLAVQDTLRATVDTLVWQSLASVMIPGFTINMIVKVSRLAVRKSPLVVPALVAEWFPTASGLGSIPIIIKPIDASVDMLLDNTTREWWQESKL